MMEMEQILTLAQTFGLWVIFAALFVNERTAHNETRKQHRLEMQEMMLRLIESKEEKRA
jgi:hypothetical protein